MSKNITVSMFSDYMRIEHYNLWLAVNHHKTHNNKSMTFKDHFYLKEILSDKSRHRVLKKSTQGGVSECLIIISWAAASSGKVVFYVLPTDGLKNRFVANRFEKSLLFSEYYREQLTIKKSNGFEKSFIDNKSLKDIGEGVISFAGSKSDVPFIEIPADWLIVDEADKCDPNRLKMGIERLGHSNDPHEIYVGNPSFLGSFLDEKYAESTMSAWTIKCDCGHYIEIDFFEHVIKQIDEHDYIIRDKNFDIDSESDIMPVCDKCEKLFDRFSMGQYISKKKSDISGKHISRVFSGTTSLRKMVDNFSKALENDYKMQRFYNSDLGESYTAEGSNISLDCLVENASDYLLPSSCSFPCIMGIDVGSIIHVRINKLLPDKRKQAVFIGTVQELPELFSLVNRYNVIAGIIDALPELRLSRKFSHSGDGLFRCFFGSDKSDSINIKEKTITVSRTMAIDDMKENIVTKNIIFPKNIISMNEYTTHMQEPTRVWDEDRKEYKWLSNRADHFFFAETYCNLAEKILKFKR